MTPPAATPPSPEELVAQAGAALQRNDARMADQLTTRLLQLFPNRPDVQHVAGLVALKLQKTALALEHLQYAANLAPRHFAYRMDFAKALVKARYVGPALEAANAAFGLDPDEPMALSTLGLIYTQCHAHQRAAVVFRRAAELAPQNVACRFNLAMSFAFGGEVARAEQELDACLALDPRYWPAHGLLARLRTQTPASNHVRRLRTLVDQTAGDPKAETLLQMALGKELEDLGEFAGAFDHFVRGKAAAGRRIGYAAARDQELVQALMRAFPAASRDTAGYRSEEPIFVIGMPRSGTTLVERILSSHPEVHSAGELDDFRIALARLTGADISGPLSPKTLDQIDSIDWIRLGELYLGGTRPATSLKPRFVDKLPHNFLYAGFIARALPNAKIVCLRRNPLDTCLSNLREPFSEASPFHGYSFDLMDIGRYYVLFDTLMTHWKKVLPDRILEIRYESLVESQEDVSRSLLEFCGLPWTDTCLAFNRNPSPAATASSLQIRAPIHRAAAGRWKNYAAQLDGLRSLLESSGIDCEA